MGSAFARPPGAPTAIGGANPPTLEPRPDSGVALATWLKDNHLNDKTVATLRDNGCDTMENLRSLHPEDLPALGLPIGQQRRLDHSLCCSLSHGAQKSKFYKTH